MTSKPTKRRKSATTPTLVPPPAASVYTIAARLDREADAELFAGRHLRAEYLAQRAFALREALA